MKPLTQKLIVQLRKANLSTEDRLALTTALLDKLNALPIGDMVHFTETGLMINGNELNLDQALSFREAAVTLKDNYARRVIHEQIRHQATEAGIHKAKTIDEALDRAEERLGLRN